MILSVDDFYQPLRVYDLHHIYLCILQPSDFCFLFLFIFSPVLISFERAWRFVFCALFVCCSLRACIFVVLMYCVLILVLRIAQFLVSLLVIECFARLFVFPSCRKGQQDIWMMFVMIGRA